MTDWPTDTVTELLDKIALTTGHHTNGVEACAMDLIGMAIEGEWTDTPECVHKLLSNRVHRINDHKETTAGQRRRLVLDAGPLLIGTADRNIEWAVMVVHRAGLTSAGLVEALETTEDRADLHLADLRFAHLNSADLHLADLSSANLRYADWNQLTLWPEGFTPPERTK